MRAAAAKKLAVPVDDLPELHLLRRAIDARGKHTRFHVLLGVGLAASRTSGRCLIRKRFERPYAW